MNIQESTKSAIASGTEDHEDAKSSWGKGLKYIAIATVVIAVGTFTWLSLNTLFSGSTSASAGPSLFETIFLSASILGVVHALPSKWRGLVRGVGIAIPLLWGLWFFSPFLDKVEERIDRCVNTGDCSEPADHIPTIDGGVLRLKSGESQTVMISGKVRVPNLICHVINASPETEMSWDAGGKNIFLRPFGNLEQQITTITAIPSTESRACREYWRKIRLGR